MISSDNKFKLISNTIDNGIILVDLELNVLHWNRWLATRTNISEDEILNKNLVEFYPKINQAILKRKIKASLTLNSPAFYNTSINKFLFDIPLNKITNRIFDQMQQGITITPYDLEKGQVFIYIYDYTPLFELNNKLEKEVKKSQSLLNATMEAILIFEDNICTKSNQVALEMFKFEDNKELIGKKINSFFQSFDKNNYAFSSSYETIMIDADNNEFSSIIKFEKLSDNNDSFILTIIDISDLKKKEKLLTKQSKMAALGEMIGNIAHQWRQPLSAIATATSGIKLQKELNILTDELFYESTSAILSNTKHLSQTIDDFKNFLNDDKAKVYFDVNERIEHALNILSGSIKSHDIEIIKDYKDKIEIFNYKNEFTQALFNILNNSKDAFIQNNIKEKKITIKTVKKADNFIIEIRDNAGGINKNIIDKVFEPYFTTKHKYKGTGIGLYMTHQIICFSMGGDIQVKNSNFGIRGKTYTGATFTIILPIH